VAKARRSRAAKKGTSKSKGSKAARKAARPRRKAVKPAKAAKEVKKVELKRLRAQFAGVLDVLSTKQSATPEVAAKLDDTRRRVSQWMTDIDDICSPELQEICGPDMVFPLPA
jgi:type VI protein secretion system component VasK